MPNNLKKVLIITYYWPPSGGSGVQRYLYFSKYLNQFGWEPVIYTVTEDKYTIIDKNLQDEVPSGVKVLRKGFWDPSNLFNFLTGRKKKVINDSVFAESKSLLSRFLIWVRGNLFIPDAKLFWIKPSARYLNKYLKNNHVDAIISTSPPQSCHLIALKVSKKNKIPWVADFRDPWTGIGYFEDLKLTKMALKRHQKLESKVLKEASEVVTVTQTWVNDLRNIVERPIQLIHNGYSASEAITIEAEKGRTNYIWSYVGTLTTSRNPVNLWNAIEKKYTGDNEFAEKFELNFIGNISDKIKTDLERYSFFSKVTFVPQVSKKQLDVFYLNSDVLLLVGIPNVPGVLPAKVFEYLKFNKRILNISAKESETELLLNKINGGLSANFEDTELVSEHVDVLFEAFQNNEPVKIEKIDQFSRVELTKKLADVLNGLSN